MRRRPHWVCKACHAAFTDIKPLRPARTGEKGARRLRGHQSPMVMACHHCGGQDFNYFPSKLEYNRYQELVILEASGAIRDLKLHPAFKLTINNEPFRVIMDFSFTECETGARVVEDVKSTGTDTPLSRIKRALVAENFGVMTLLTQPKRQR
jgi:hypothetical protein